MNISITNLAAPISAPAEPAAAQAEDQRVLIRAVKALNASDMFGGDNELTFALDRTTRRAIVRIVNKDTREVLEQIPAEYVLRMAEEMNRGE